MVMRDREIKDRYVRKGVTIKILAELNACDEEDIRRVLKKQGVDVPKKRKEKAGMTLGELFKIMDNQDLIRVKRGNEVLYAGFLGMVENKTLDGYDFERVNAPEDAEIKKIKAVQELRHRNYKALELEPPLKPDITPMYKFSDLQMQLYYDIYI